MLQIDAERGAYVVINADADVQVVRRTPPVLRPAPAFPDLVGRAAEMHRIRAALSSGSSVEVFGPSGVGKTTLVRAASNAPLPSTTPDGVVAVPARLGVQDTLTYLFDSCYQGTHRIVPRWEELAESLHGLQLLVVLDDSTLERDDVDSLRSALPSSLILLAGPEQRLFGGADSLPLGGLPVADGVALIESRAGRLLSEHEREVAARVCEVLHGTPLELVRFAALVRRDQADLESVARGFGIDARPEDLLRAVRRSTSDAEDAVLAALVAFEAPVGAGPIAAFTGQPYTGEILVALARRGLVQGDDLRGWQSRERLPAPPEDRHRAATALIGWARQRTVPEEVAAETPAIAAAMSTAREDRRFVDAIVLAAAVESALALAGRWAAWGDTLRAGLDASTRAGDAASGRFFTHQLAVLDDAMSAPPQPAPIPPTPTGPAGPTTTSSRAAMSAGPPGPPVLESRPPRRPWWRQPPFIAAVLILVLAIVGGAVVLRGSGSTGPGPGPSASTLPSEPTTPPETTPPTETTTPPAPRPNLKAAIPSEASGPLTVGQERPVRVGVLNPRTEGMDVAGVDGGELTVEVTGPAELSVVTGSDCNPESRTRITCPFGEIAPDGAVEFVLLLQGRPDGSADVTVTATARSDQGDTATPASESFSVACIVPNVEGQVLDTAEAAVRQAGLVPVPVPTEAGLVGKVVVETEPRGGQQLGCGEDVRLRYNTLQ